MFIFIFDAKISIEVVTMKKAKDFMNIEAQDNKSNNEENRKFHKITLENDKQKQLGEKKISEIKQYFSNLKNKYIEDNKGRYRILIPGDAYDLKVLIDDLETILNS